MSKAPHKIRQLPGFLVWNPGRGVPSYRHETYEAAERERDRLRSENPGERFYVMAPVLTPGQGAVARAYSQGVAEAAARAHDEIMRAEGIADKAQERLHALRTVEANRAEFQATVADCLLWFDGFNAAFAMTDGAKPQTPDRDKLVRLNSALQAALRLAEDDSTEDDWEIPF